MNFIALPGNSSKNKGWVEEIADKLTNNGHQTKVQYYDHWTKGGSFKLSAERNKLVKSVVDVPSCGIFAKSAGIFLAIDSIKRQLINPEFCVFVGTTTRSGRMLDNWNINSLFIQETSDPFLSFDNLDMILKEARPTSYKLIEVPGNKHYYFDTEIIIDSIKLSIR